MKWANIRLAKEGNLSWTYTLAYSGTMFVTKKKKFHDFDKRMTFGRIFLNRQPFFIFWPPGTRFMKNWPLNY